MRMTGVVIQLTMLFLGTCCTYAQVLTLKQSIPVPGVKGEFDHVAIDLAGKRLYVAAEDQKTVEVVDLALMKHVSSIALFARPHGLAFVPSTRRLLVADGNDGSLKFVDPESPKVLQIVKTALRADSVAYDRDAETVFVASGGVVAKMDYSLLTWVSTATAEKRGEVRLDSKILEAIGFERNGNRIFVNLMDKAAVAVIDRRRQKLESTWALDGAEQNSAIALDEEHHQLLVACRKPGKLLVLDTRSGKTIAGMPCIGHADDAHFDPKKGRLYVSGGDGAVSVYERDGSGELRKLEDVPTGKGAKTSLFVPELEELIVAVPAGETDPAKILIFAAN